MGERKVLNKYYPPDFDGTKLIRNRRPRDQQELIRFMLPCTVRCNTCGEYMYAGKKFNVKKETVLSENYLGLKIYRFYLKCVACSSPFTIKTDPKNADYMCETGATRNFEPWRQQQVADDEVREALDENEMDAMQALENRTMDAKEQMDILDALEEVKSLRSKQAKVDFDVLLAVQRRRFMNVERAEAGGAADVEHADELEDARLAGEAFDAKRRRLQRVSDDAALDDETSKKLEPPRDAPRRDELTSSLLPSSRATPAVSTLGGMGLAVKFRNVPSVRAAPKGHAKPAPKAELKPQKQAVALSSLLGGYASNSEDDESKEAEG